MWLTGKDSKWIYKCVWINSKIFAKTIAVQNQQMSVQKLATTFCIMQHILSKKKKKMRKTTS